MPRCPTFFFQLSIMSKWIAKLISTKVSFKITIRKIHVYIDIGWPWIWNNWFYLGIRNDDRNKMIVLPSFQLATRLNSQNTNETEFIIELWHIHLFMNIGISNWHNWNLDLTLIFFFDFISGPYTITDLQAHETLQYISRGPKWNYFKTCYRSPQNAKKKISWNIKTKYVTDFLLRVSSSSRKDYTCLYVVST